MPVLILLGIFTIWGAASLGDSCSKKAPPMSRDDLDNILKETCGKSQKECKRILKGYRRS